MYTHILTHRKHRSNSWILCIFNFF